MFEKSDIRSIIIVSHKNICGFDSDVLKFLKSL